MLAGSVFLGLDTVLGPVYLAYGHAEQGLTPGSRFTLN
jgi:hypothetical protein